MSDEFEKRWESFSDEYLKFDHIPETDRPCGSPDVCAFLFLDRKFPDERNMDMVSAAKHDEIYLRVESDQLETLTNDEIIYLVRCGCRFDGDGLAMFV